MPIPEHDGRKRVVIESVTPDVDAGRFAAKRTIGDSVRVEADVFTDGHDALSAEVLWRHEKSAGWNQQRMQFIVNDRWFANFPVTELGRYRYTVRGWVDRFETWRRDLLKRIAAEQDAPVDYLIGADLMDLTAGQLTGPEATWLASQAALLRSDSDKSEKRARATDPALADLVSRFPDRTVATQFERELEIVVDPVLARFCAWYELFPRSTSSVPGRHGTFGDLEKRLPAIAAMGFDIVYLPPVHPIGVQYRKGKNNSTTAEADDEGSPWAIGGMDGGHKSIHPKLGTLADFKSLIDHAQKLNLHIALDIAFQVSPDHPYAREHEEWFRKRPDGTIQYAENPPKKYQDIYPFDFETSAWLKLWQELKSVFDFWIEQGVRVFRVDNPHTKPFPFWEWVITELKRAHPELLFLSEAFTRPKIMYRLAKLGFSQSYTYFPWRNGKQEIASYITELTKTGVREFFRPSQWPNTPDILTEFLQTSGRAGFMIRLILAATLGASYGIYGPAFELQEGRPRHLGSEEYLDSEKYQIREWSTESPDSLRELITLVNRIRRENIALQSDWSVEFHPATDDQIICYSKQSDDASNLIVVVVNLDPHHTRSAFIDLPLEKLKIDAAFSYQAHDLLSGARYLWSGPRNYVELNPEGVPAHILRIRRRVRSESDFEYFL